MSESVNSPFKQTWLNYHFACKREACPVKFNTLDLVLKCDYLRGVGGWGDWPVVVDIFYGHGVQMFMFG